MADIKVYFKAINAASQVIRAVSDEINQVFGPKLDMGKTFGNFVSTLQPAIAATKEIMQTIDEMTLAGAKIESMRQSYESLTSDVGANSRLMLEDLRKGSAGLISDTNLMMAANRAMLLGVADDASKMETLLKVAISRGRAFGKDATDAFNDIVLGLGRTSPMILDNLGIAIRLGPTYDKFAKSIGTTADQLDDAQKKQALYNAILVQSEDILKNIDEVYASNLSNLERAATARENFMNTIKESMAGPFSGMSVLMTAGFEEGTRALHGNFTGLHMLLEAYVAMQLRASGVSEQYIESLRRQSQAARDNWSEQDRLNEAHLRVYNAMSQARAGLESATLAAQNHADEQRMLHQALVTTGGEMVTFANLAYSAGVSLENLSKYAQEVRERMNNFAGQYDVINSLEKQTANAIMNSAANAMGLMGGKEATGALVREQLAALEQSTNQIKQQGLDAVDLRLTYAQLQSDLAGPFTSAIEANKAGQKAWKAEVKDTAKEFENLKGKVEGVLSGALDPGVGVNPSQILEELGMRPDAINENARRMADIAVNGFKSPWFDYFKEEFPALFQQFFAGANGDSGIRAQAATLLQNFQDGLMPELLDKEQAKERVRRMLIGEQRMADLAQEIAAELSQEMGGVSFTQALSAAQGALGGGASANNETGYTSGDAFKAGLIDSVKSGDLGSQIATHLADQILAESNLAISNEAGRQHGSAWGQGFLSEVGDNVPPELIDILATLVTPAVIAKQNVRATQTGAQQ